MLTEHLPAHPAPLRAHKERNYSVRPLGKRRHRFGSPAGAHFPMVPNLASPTSASANGPWSRDGPEFGRNNRTGDRASNVTSVTQGRDECHNHLQCHGLGCD
jgi:hypothetical protein